MIAVDTSVCVKWFKAGERYESEAQALRQLIEAQQAEAVANEITSLEIVRGLKNAQLRQPSIGRPRVTWAESWLRGGCMLCRILPPSAQLQSAIPRYFESS